MVGSKCQQHRCDGGRASSFTGAPSSRSQSTRASRSPAAIHTLVDLAACLDPAELEAAINQADKLDLVSPEQLRSALDSVSRRPDLPCLRDLLDRQTFPSSPTPSSSDSSYRSHMRAGLGLTRRPARVLNGYKVDFYWPALSLVVETDGLRYHRTPAQQAADRRRDQTQTAAGLIVLRFTHAQVRFELH